MKRAAIILTDEDSVGWTDRWDNGHVALTDPQLLADLRTLINGIEDVGSGYEIEAAARVRAHLGDDDAR